MLQTAMKTLTVWVTDRSFHVTYTRFWPPSERCSRRRAIGTQPASRLSVTLALMVIMSCCLLIGWLDSCINNQLNKPVGTVFLIKWPKTLAVSVEPQVFLETQSDSRSAQMSAETTDREVRRLSHLSAPIMHQVYSKHVCLPENPVWPWPRLSNEIKHWW